MNEDGGDGGGDGEKLSPILKILGPILNLLNVLGRPILGSQTFETSPPYPQDLSVL